MDDACRGAPGARSDKRIRHYQDQQDWEEVDRAYEEYLGNKEDWESFEDWEQWPRPAAPAPRKTRKRTDQKKGTKRRRNDTDTTLLNAINAASVFRFLIFRSGDTRKLFRTPFSPLLDPTPAGEAHPRLKTESAQPTEIIEVLMFCTILFRFRRRWQF